MNVSLLHGSAIWRPSEDTSGRDVKFLDFLAESFISNESVNDNSTKNEWISHLADTFVVKETQSVTKDSGVVPVMSSHCAGDVPPV